MRLRRDERGQSAVLAVVFITVLLGMSAAVLDVGSWFRADRRAQATADAAALAGAQALPDDPAGAQALAVDYGAKNGDALAPNEVSLASTLGANDTIKVTFKRPAPGFFSKIFGIASVDVGASATARAFLPAQARWVAPIVVNKLHPKLAGPGCPCFGPGNPTTLPLGKTGAPGAFDMLNLDPSDQTARSAPRPSRPGSTRASTSTCRSAATTRTRAPSSRARRSSRRSTTASRRRCSSPSTTPWSAPARMRVTTSSPGSAST